MTSPTPTLDLTILILCRDEETSIAQCVKDASGFLERNAICGEVLVLDNDSQDRSAQFAKQAGARVVAEARPGYGSAIIAGIAAARGRFVILGDGDGEHDLGVLEPFWERLQEGYHLVVGNRFVHPPSPGAMRFLNRYIGAPLLSGIGNLFYRSPAHDFHCGLRGFDTTRVRALNLEASGMEAASEMLIKAVHHNLRITEVPVSQRPAADPLRIPHLQIWRDGWRHLKLLFLFSPRWLFLYPGCLGIVSGLFLLVAPLWLPSVFGTYSMLFGMGASSCGTQIIGFYMVANLLGGTQGLNGDEWLVWAQRHPVLEISVIAGLTLALLGVAGCFWSFYAWAQSDKIVADVVNIERRLRIAIPSIALLILSVQSVFFGFLAAFVTGGDIRSFQTPTSAKRT